jgi:hypothetical protein
MRINKIIRHTNGRSRDIYGAWGCGKTHMNFLISIIAPWGGGAFTIGVNLSTAVILSAAKDLCPPASQTLPLRGVYP